MRDASPDPLIGTTVSHYSITAKLGGGGMGVVYAARDERLGRRVALKFLPPQWSHDDGAKERFIREAQAASSTDHRNICTVHDIDTAPDGRLFIVMAHYDGPTLKQRLETGPLSVDEAIEVAAQTAEGLARAHAQGIVHRDIKPGNLILADDGVRILDFGLARFAGSLQLTLDGSTLGTVAYMSPEQSRGEDADVRSDLWSVGIVLYEMLTGRLPFRGAYPEAILTAIRTETTPALGLPAKDGGEVLDRIVGRVLTKDPAQRYQSAREMARDLRLVQGRTLPVDLRTEAVGLLPSHLLRRGRRRWRGGLAMAATLMALLAGAAAWVLLAPVERVAIAVAPVVNQTGYAELDPYRMALTQELIAELSNLPTLRVTSYDRVLGAIRRFRDTGGDPSSRDALQAVATSSDAQMIVVPTLLYDDGAWRGRVEFRNAGTATTDAAFDTAPVVSSLAKETAYRLMSPLAAAVQNQALSAAPRPVALLSTIRRLVNREPYAPAATLPNVEAAAAFEAGMDAYERLEYAAALAAFTKASAADPRDPLLLAWRSRTARMMRYDREAADLAAQASALPTAALPRWKRLLIEAIAAEGSRAVPLAQERYRALAASFPDEARWVMEVGGFQEREEQNTDAIASYQAALALDSRIMRPHLELCRLYNRLNETANAREHGQKALAGYRAAGDRWLEAQALFCVADTLRTGGRPERDQARAAADEALKVLESSGARYQLGRAYFYVALVAGTQGRLPESVALGQQALMHAQTHGNTILQPQILLNLGAASNILGDRQRALEYYQASVQGFEGLGDERRAAQAQANGAGIVASYGGDRERAVRDLGNALRVSRQIGDKPFEVLCLQLIGAFHRDAGRLEESERTLREALAIARERDLMARVTTLLIDLAAVRSEAGDIAGSRTLLDDAARGAGDTDLPRIRIRLAEAKLASGDIPAARADLEWAESRLTAANAAALRSLLNTVAGAVELAANRRDDARRRFAVAASASRGDQLPDPATIEARAYLGLVDAMSGQVAQGRAGVEAALAQARIMGRQSLIDRCAQFLARTRGDR